MINTTNSIKIMSKFFTKNYDNKKVTLETSNEINARVNSAPLSKDHAQLQQALVNLLVVNDGRRDVKWIEKFIALRNQCIELHIWQGFNDKYNLHRGFTAEYV
jgi:hypothetical protein